MKYYSGFCKGQLFLTEFPAESATQAGCWARALGVSVERSVFINECPEGQQKTHKENKCNFWNSFSIISAAIPEWDKVLEVYKEIEF